MGHLLSTARSHAQILEKVVLYFSSDFLNIWSVFILMKCRWALYMGHQKLSMGSGLIKTYFVGCPHVASLPQTTVLGITSCPTLHSPKMIFSNMVLCNSD